MTKELRKRALMCSENRVARLMRLNNLRVKPTRGFHSITRRNKANPVAPNLLQRNFTAERPNQIWLADITYIPTQVGWLYLAVLLDLYSRRIVGWAMNRHITEELDDPGAENGPGPAPPGSRDHASLGPGESIHESNLSSPVGGEWICGEYEWRGYLVRQCADGEFLWFPQSRTRLSQVLCHALSGDDGFVLVH